MELQPICCQSQCIRFNVTEDWYLCSLKLHRDIGTDFRFQGHVPEVRYRLGRRLVLGEAVKVMRFPAKQPALFPPLWRFNPFCQLPLRPQIIQGSRHLAGIPPGLLGLLFEPIGFSFR
ncbi:hypothetical protein [Acaryochloris marina]|uniref:hypothetical protein n=1 Tax=Acaryochloris marina TaxID=155978 RepID=UPI0021C45600|nr:hypothetical protein [Acaryochloris marina]